MPKVRRIDPQNAPELFFLPDGEENYTLPNEDLADVSAYPDAIKVLKKKVFDGVAFLAVLSEKLQVWWKKDADASPVMVAEAELVGEMWTGSSWASQMFSFEEGNLTKIDNHYRAFKLNPIAVAGSAFGLELWWEQGQVKWLFYADVPGRTIRIKWRCRVRDAAIADPENDKKGLSWSVADYPGEVDHSTFDDAEAGWSGHVWTFEPSGFVCLDADGRTPGERFADQAGLYVDPYLGVDDAAATITITTSEDEIAFTVATANAELVENTSVRAMVREDYYFWTIYDNRMFRWRHDTGATTTGMSGNDYSAVQVSGELYWYPLTSSENTNEATITGHLQDATKATDTTGSFLSDLNIPDNFVGDGFAADGAIHIDSAAGQVGIDWDDTWERPSVAIHDPGFQYGDPGSPTDLLTFLWHCESTSTEVGGKTMTLSNVSLVSNGGIRGNCYASSGGYHAKAYCAVTDEDIISTAKGTLIFWFKGPANTTGAAMIFCGGQTGNFRLRYSGDILIAEIGTSTLFSEHCLGLGGGSGDGQWHLIHFAWNNTTEQAFLAVDGTCYGFANFTGLSGAITQFECVGGNYASPNCSEDHIQIFGEMILPYGAYFTGYEQFGDYDKAHSSILFYWDGSDCTSSNVQIGSLQLTKGGSGGTFQTSGGIGSNDDYFDTEGTAEFHATLTEGTQIDCNKGGISFWFNIQTISAGDALFGIGDATDYIQAVMDASGNIDVTYQSQSTAETITGNIACGTGEWHHMRITFDDSGGDTKVHSYIDGVENGTAQTIANTFSPNATDVLYIGADYAGANVADILVDELFITNDPNTPQIWTAFGRPLHVPLLEVS